MIELLVVVAIVGILAAIAIPQFASYRARAFNARVASDARNAATAQEAYFSDVLAYYGGDCAGLTGFKPSDGVSCTATLVGADQFQITTTHPQMSYTTGCTWLSNPGGGGGNLSCS